MTREEILKNWTIVEVAAPRKGEFFMTVKNFDPKGNSYGISQAPRDMKYVALSILEKR